jgi:sulfur-oxidizing protein SoxX
MEYLKRLVLGVLLLTAFGATAGGNEIPASLTGTKGDPVRGRALVANRQVGLCLLCHSGPFPEERFQGNLAPDLRSAARLNEGEIRARIVDPRRSNPETIMPAYFETSGQDRVAPSFRGKTILSAEQIEDIVAYLVSLK